VPSDEPAGLDIGRLVRSSVHGVAHFIARRSPRATIDRLHEQLLHAGLTTRISAEEMLMLNGLTAAAGIGAGVLWITLGHPPARMGIIALVLLSLAGVCVPRAWLTRHLQARQDAIFKALPDALDLMVIAMEAGVGFDGAIQTVAEHMEGPLAEELLRSLAEMELGVTRREALQNLRRRVDVPALNYVIISLLQADALGMPVSRVLRVQANEMRQKRRQWAREKAGKLPVKILLPLVLFIFPPVMVVVLGPAVPAITKMF
jgi:tight adherence protein C